MKVKASERIVTEGWEADNLIDIYIYTSSLSNDRDVATHHSGKWSDEKIKFRARLLHKESGRCDFLFVFLIEEVTQQLRRSYDEDISAFRIISNLIFLSLDLIII